MSSSARTGSRPLAHNTFGEPFFSPAVRYPSSTGGEPNPIPLVTLSQRRLLRAVRGYQSWKATACLKALQRSGNECPLISVLGYNTIVTAYS